MTFPRKTNIDTANCESIINCTLRDLIGLTGIYGYSTVDPKEMEVEAHFYETDPDEIHVWVNYDGIRLNRIVNFAQKLIKNESFLNVKATQVGIGTNVFLSQIQHARDRGFKTIEVTAQKANINGSIPYVGHIVWAKLGFSMSEDSKAQFDQILKNTPYDGIVSNVFDLISTSKAGETFWTVSGDTWHGSYDLATCSDNDLMTYFYKSKRCRKK